MDIKRLQEVIEGKKEEVHPFCTDGSRSVSFPSPPPSLFGGIPIVYDPSIPYGTTAVIIPSPQLPTAYYGCQCDNPQWESLTLSADTWKCRKCKYAILAYNISQELMKTQGSWPSCPTINPKFEHNLRLLEAEIYQHKKAYAAWF